MTTRDVIKFAQEAIHGVILNVVEHFYGVFMDRERNKRYVHHVSDTIDFGYYGLADAPLEYQIYPIIQDFEHKESFDLFYGFKCAVNGFSNKHATRPPRPLGAMLSL